MKADDLRFLLAVLNQPWPRIFGVWVAPSNRWLGDDEPAMSVDAGELATLIPYADLDTAARPEVYRVAVIPEGFGAPTEFITPSPPVNPLTTDLPRSVPIEPGPLPEPEPEPLFDYTSGLRPVSPTPAPRPSPPADPAPFRPPPGFIADPNTDPVTGNPIVYEPIPPDPAWDEILHPPADAGGTP